MFRIKRRGPGNSGAVRVAGAHAIMSGAGKRSPTIPVVTGAPARSVPFANQALPGKPSRGLATNFGARGIAPFRPGSLIGTKTSFQPLTRRRLNPFQQVLPPALEAPALRSTQPQRSQPLPARPIPGGAKGLKVALRQGRFVKVRR